MKTDALTYIKYEDFLIFALYVYL